MKSVRTPPLSPGLAGFRDPKQLLSALDLLTPREKIRGRLDEQREQEKVLQMATVESNEGVKRDADEDCVQRVESSTTRYEPAAGSGPGVRGTIRNDNCSLTEGQDPESNSICHSSQATSAKKTDRKVRVVFGGYDEIKCLEKTCFGCPSEQLETKTEVANSIYTFIHGIG